MPSRSTVFRTAEGSTVIACSRGPAKKCSVCKKAPATQLCDHPEEMGTCDAALCKACSVRGPHGSDFCPTHAEQAKK